MKHNLLYYAVSAMLLGSTLASCSSDSVVENEPQVAERDSKLFIQVALADATVSSTRADGAESNEDPDNYSNGSVDERAIHSVLFVFYDAMGNFITSEPLEVDKEGGDQTVTEGGNNGSLETLIKIVVPVDVKQGQGMPEYVMAYVNPTNKAGNDLEQAFDKIRPVTRKLEHLIPGIDPENKTHTGFTMNNSVYYTGVAGDLPSIRTKLPKAALFETYDEANNNNDEARQTTIYVERVVAKVVVTSKDASGNDITNLTQTNNTATAAEGTDEYTLKFTPLAWGVNNVEPQTFLIKNFRKTRDNVPANGTLSSLTNMTFTEASNEMEELQSPSWNYYEPVTGDGATDNPKGGHRTFWAYSTTYFSNNESLYPENADIYNNNEGNKFALTYRKYNEIWNGTTTGKYGQTISNPLYTLEHTNQPAVITSNMDRAISSVTVVGEYQLFKGTEALEAGTTFYMQRAIPTDANSKNRIYVSEDNMKKAFMKENHVVYIHAPKVENGKLVRDKDNKIVYDYVYVPYGDKTYTIEGEVGSETLKEIDNPYLADFSVAHPTSDIYGKVPMASRYVTLLFKPSAYTSDSKSIYYYRDENGVMQPVNANNLVTVGKDLFACMSEHFKAMEAFKNGKAYFNVPIKHLWAKTDSSLGSAKLGEYGVVRNHIYRINIQGIDGIGTGIGDPNVPIIPGIQEKTYYVKSELRVNRWRLVPQQDVTLKPNN